MRVLLVKMSSLGDVVHALTGVTDASRAIPGIRFDWVVESAYKEIPSWHPAVRRIIPCAFRRWRASLLSAKTRDEWNAFRQELGAESYDIVLDAQGLLKSALISRLGRGRTEGRSYGSAREAAAAAFYQERHAVDLTLPEVEQLRQLFALTFGYPQPRMPADFSIDRNRLPDTSNYRRPYCLFLHGAAWESKLWPVKRWIEVGEKMVQAGVKVLLPWGNEFERTTAQTIARACGGEVLPALGIGQLAAVISKASFVIGADTGLTHIAIALGVRTVALYGPSVPVYDKVAGVELINLCTSDSTEVDTSRKNDIPVDRVLNALEPWK